MASRTKLASHMEMAYMTYQRSSEWFTGSTRRSRVCRGSRPCRA